RLGVLDELGLVDAGYVAARGQLDAGDLEAAFTTLDVHLRGRVDRCRYVTGLAEDVGQRHRVAAGMRRRDQLLGACARSVLETGDERVRTFVGAGAQRHPAGAFFEVSLPAGRGGTGWHEADASPCRSAASVAGRRAKLRGLDC